MISQSFDITITADSVDAISGSSVGPKSRHIASALFSTVLVIYLIAMVSDVFFGAAGNSASTRSKFDFVIGIVTALTILWVILGMTFYVIRSFFPNGDAIHCEHNLLSVRKIPTFNFRGQWKTTSFPINDVVGLHFGLVRFSRYNTATGLIFTVNGKKIKVFDTLQIPEAVQILDGLQKLGVDTVRDPGERMSVEMVLERRNSKLGRLLS